MIKIECKANDTLAIEKMKLFQGTLKTRLPEDYVKIQKSIEQYGFSFPFFIWNYKGDNWVIDGTGRYETLNKMKEAGEKIPELPVVYINCKDKEDAKQILLRINSQYGSLSQKSVEKFSEDIEVEYADLDLPEGCIDFSEDEDEPLNLEYDTGTSEDSATADTFAMTFDIDNGYRDKVQEYIRQNGKQQLVKVVMELAGVEQDA